MDTVQYVPVMVFGFAASLGLTPLSRQIAMRLGVIDRPRKRNITKKPTPMMGGLAIFVALALSLALFSPAETMGTIWAILAGAAWLALVGLVDDRYELGLRVKFVAIVIAALIVTAAGVRVELTGIVPLDVFIGVFWIAAITNATNFLDNMDGLTAGISAIAGGFFMVIAVFQDSVVASLLAAAVFGSALGFLSYNFNPASTFMGDMGALMLGFVLAILGIELEFGATTLGVSWVIPLLVLALPTFDINLVIFTRLSEGRSPGEAGKDHTSHRLMSLGLSQRQTLFVLYGACMFFGTMGLLISQVERPVAWVLGVFNVILLLSLFAVMTWIRRRYKLELKKPPQGSETS